jgi:hypothetical protein
MDDKDKLMLASLENDMFSSDANGLLDRQLDRARKWMDQRRANGEVVNQYEFTKHCMREPSRKRHIVAAYCAAMWRMIHQEGR